MTRNDIEDVLIVTTSFALLTLVGIVGVAHIVVDALATLFCPKKQQKKSAGGRR